MCSVFYVDTRFSMFFLFGEGAEVLNANFFVGGCRMAGDITS